MCRRLEAVGMTDAVCGVIESAEGIFTPGALAALYAVPSAAGTASASP
jgi:hypothetical protein